MNNFNFSNYPNSIQEKIQDPNTDYSAFIVKPPEKNITTSRIERLFVIDSRDRDRNLYPNSNNYRVLVPQEWRDVVSSELIYGELPNTYYNINDENNIMYLSDTPYNLIVVKIPEGKYSNQQLIEILNGSKGDLFSEFKSKFNFSRDQYTKKLRISSNNGSENNFIYNFNYTQNAECSSSCHYNNIDAILGFSSIEYVSDTITLTDYNIQSITDLATLSDDGYPLRKIIVNNYDLRTNLVNGDYLIIESSGNKYEIRINTIINKNTMNVESIDGTNPTGLSGKILLDISVLISPNMFNVEVMPYIVIRLKSYNGFNLLFSNSDNASDSSYAVISLLKDNKTIICNATLPKQGIVKYFNPPLPRMQWVEVRFLNYDGTPFNFRGMENMLTIKLTLLNQPGKYNP